MEKELVNGCVGGVYVSHVVSEMEKDLDAWRKGSEEHLKGCAT